jgi:16S rRNA (cytosine1407-C5)-methyltransferase
MVFNVNFTLHLLDSSRMNHPFDRYTEYTDVAALKKSSETPLRKCMRVNTFKMNVEDFRKYAESKNWKLKPVPWCTEGFFIDREDRSVPLGKDLLHLLGITYMQEASSMLPVAMLDPKPGENILDMAAAPGSKSTQIAAKMNNRGVLVANDMQEARLQTLRSALNRLGIMNVIVTKKMGQWFGKHMTGRFDRVLIDAPCTGQGTARKDSTALKYCSIDSIGKNAKLQRELLEAAVHATNIGGRIVYSTCTLTPEENEDVVFSALRKFPNQLEVVDPSEIINWDCSQAIKDSYTVQESLETKIKNIETPMLRIWPQTYDSEGFFCAVLKKTAPTKEAEKYDLVKLDKEPLSKGKVKEVCEFLEHRFGTSFKNKSEVLLQHKERLWITTEEVFKFKLPCPNAGIGLPFGKTLSKSPVMIDHDLATLRGSDITTGVIDLTEEEWKLLARGQDIDCDPELFGKVLFRYNGLCIGRGNTREGRCKNQLPRWIIQVLS